MTKQLKDLISDFYNFFRDYSWIKKAKRLHEQEVRAVQEHNFKRRLIRALQSMKREEQLRRIRAVKVGTRVFYC